MRRLVHQALFFALILACAPLRAEEAADLSKTYDTTSAAKFTAPTRDGKKDGLKLSASGTSKKAHLASSAKVMSPRKTKNASLTRSSSNSNRLNPARTGAKKMSLQDYNRYAYRKSNSSKAGVPVVRAGSGSAKRKQSVSLTGQQKDAKGRKTGESAKKSAVNVEKPSGK
jgi:hypothetical protein